MAGLNFLTQTIINSNYDPDSEGKLFEYLTEGYRDETTSVTNGDPYLLIKRDFAFVKKHVERIVYKPGKEATMCEAEIDFTNLATTLQPTEGVNYCRLDIYVGLEGAEPFIYATPWVQKGKPFWIEFIVKKGDTAQIIADRVENTIKKNHIFQIDKDLIKVINDGAGKLTLKGATEFLRFKKIEIQEFDSYSDYADVVATLGSAAPITLKARGENAFGTYSQVIKDLRLPTAANYQWQHIRQVETPIVGAIYDQFIIDYCAPATSHPLSVVGGRLDSHTTHVFWVKHDVAAEFAKALKNVGTIINATTGVADTTLSIESLTSGLAVVVDNKSAKTNK